MKIDKCSMNGLNFCNCDNLKLYILYINVHVTVYMFA